MKRIFRYAALVAFSFAGLSAYAMPALSSGEKVSGEVRTLPQDEKKGQSRSFSEGFPFDFDKDAFVAQMDALREQMKEKYESTREDFDKLMEEFSKSKEEYLAQLPKFSEESMDALREQLEEGSAEMEKLRERFLTERGWGLYDDEDYSFPSEGEATPSTVTKNYNLKDFTGISASGVFKVEVSNGPFSVRVECTETYAPYLKVRVIRNNLTLGLDMPSSVSKRIKGQQILKAYVSMPKLSSVKLSGVTGIIFNDEFDLRNGVFSFEMSGASTAKGVRINSKKVNLDMSGASSGDFVMNCDSFTTSMSGASTAIYDIVAGDITLELSGASKASGTVNTDDLSLESSGSSKTDLSGKAKTIKMEGSGVSTFTLSSLDCVKASAELSGSSYARMDVRDELKVELTGASTLLYNGNRGLTPEVESVSRMSTFKKY